MIEHAFNVIVKLYSPMGEQHKVPAERVSAHLEVVQVFNDIFTITTNFWIWFEVSL